MMMIIIPCKETDKDSYKYAKLLLKKVINKKMLVCLLSNGRRKSKRE